MKYRSRFKLWQVVFLLSYVALRPPAALAQEDEPVDTGTAVEEAALEDDTISEDEWENVVLEEVIVTARKRQEALQDTPVAVTAMTGEKLREQGIANTRDLQKFVPGLSFSELGNKSASIFIRGVGQKDSQAVLDPGVGVYINGIYIPRTDTQLLDTVDTQSVQVLRGPQGTLFGKNNTGGAILVTTEQPHWEEFTSELFTRFGNFGRRDVKTNFNIPLNDDSLAMRIGFSSTQREGYLTSKVDGKKYGDEDRLGATARFFWQATDLLNVDLFYFRSKTNEQGAGLTCYFENSEAVFDTFSFPGFSEPGSYSKQCRESEALSKDNYVLLNGPSKFTLDNQIVALTLTWEFEDYEIKSISSWSRQKDIIYEDDSDATNISGVGTGPISLLGALNRSLDNGYGDFDRPDDEERYQYTQELQIIGSAFDESLSYTVGIFAAREKLNDNVYTNLVGDNGYAVKSLELSPGFTVITLLPKILGAIRNMSNETNAIFGQATYDVTDWFQLTLGARYTVENRESIARIFEANCEAVEDIVEGSNAGMCAEFTVLSLSEEGRDTFFEGAPDFLPIRRVEVYETGDPIKDENGVITGYRKVFAPGGMVEDDAKWSRSTYTVTSSFNIPEVFFEESPLDSMLIYQTYSEGFKSGGFEMRGLELWQYEPEDVANIELGIKIDAFEQRLRFNAALYYMDYRDIQIRIIDQGRRFSDIELYIDNAEAATIKGIEIELTVLPLHYLSIHAVANHTDASYDDFIAVHTTTPKEGLPNRDLAFDRSDEDFSSVPATTYSLTAIGILPTEIGVFNSSLTMYYRDEQFTGLDATAWYNKAARKRATLDDVMLWNFRLTYVPANTDRFDFTLFVDNIGDTEYFQGGFSNVESLGAGSFVKGLPRNYGLETAIRF